MSSNQQVVYMTAKIREGYEAADVTMWQQLLQSAKTEAGDSLRHLFLILDMAKHNQCEVLDIVKTGRVCSNSKSIDQKFADALIHCVDTPDDDVEVIEDGNIRRHTGPSVLDLTCNDESSGSSHSYEETSEPYNDNPTSNEAYEIDGFVVEDHESPEQSGDEDVLHPDILAAKRDAALARFGGAASSSGHLKKSTANASTADAAPTATKKKLRKRKIDSEE